MPSSPHSHAPRRNRRLAELLDECVRARDARKPPRLHPQSQSRVRFAPGGRCPFDQSLLARSMGFGGIPLTGEETARCMAAREHLPEAAIEAVTVLCVSVTVSNALRLAYRVTALAHVDLQIDEHSVHLEAINQELAGPGGVNRELRVYVGGVLTGRGHLLGRLGGTVNTLPAVARLDSDLVVTVEPVHWAPLTELIVELRGPQKPTPGDRAR